MQGIPVQREQIVQMHQLYGQLTGQQLSLGFDRERMWFELLRLGHGPEQLQRVVHYLQKEIRLGRRNVGALKLSNLLQPDRFEEDLNISQIRLQAPKVHALETTPAHLDPVLREERRKKALAHLQAIKAQLAQPPTD